MQTRPEIHQAQRAVSGGVRLSDLRVALGRDPVEGKNEGKRRNPSLGAVRRFGEFGGGQKTKKHGNKVGFARWAFLIQNKVAIQQKRTNLLTGVARQLQSVVDGTLQPTEMSSLES